ncbi:phosphoethanolamine transferase [Hylemonella gracilis]|uniref:Putative sulfatase membrane protein n=1 Tax=Hylemonella gracilis ATCC 19624 TaxID=887062 RepID=F3KQZ8_9BURK|nr:phosphoethanolamine--lipid A transferase [Hylemonella gracilis]EGI77699.1 putative sulfatase membrane protein [Hylemonella gracilis ATCC 19624]
MKFWKKARQDGPKTNKDGLIARPQLSSEALLAWGTLYVLLACNTPFWRAAMVGRDWGALSSWGFAAALLVACASAYFAFLALLTWPVPRRGVRPVLAVLFLASATAAWYMDRYAVHFDKDMLRNVLATNWDEARELLNWGLAGNVLLFGALPAALLWWPRIPQRSWTRTLVWRGSSILGALVLAMASVWSVSADFAALNRNHKEVRYLLTPANLVVAAMREAVGPGVLASRQSRQVVGADARLGAVWQQPQRQGRPALFVLVVGETARAPNFSLNGYERLTNPELTRLRASGQLVNFSHVTSCGTSTEVSLPCMFSPFGRRHYDEEQILTHESLLHVLARAGFQVLWRDNQGGCKGVCDGLPTQQLNHAKVEGLCLEGQCLDEVLVHGLSKIAADAALASDGRGNLFIVLHQLGSHGPAYFRRYPAAYKRFGPACEDESLRNCTPDQVRNAYDNSLLYTDHVLSRVVEFLDQVGGPKGHYDTAMLYLSDHGESLGESGLYLHGMPWAIAPREQTQVPMVTWLSPAFAQHFGVDMACLRERSDEALSHDNLFHSMLGLLDVQTSVYEPALDLFRPCRTSGQATAPAASPMVSPLKPAGSTR